MHYDTVVAGRHSQNVGIGLIAKGILSCVSYRLRAGYLNVKPQYTDLDSLLPHVPILPVELKPHTATTLIYTDVLWNHIGDDSIASLPRADINIAYTMFDSSSLPRNWVELCNRNFDAVVVPDVAVKRVYETSGVWKPVFSVPMPLDLEPFLSRPLAPTRRRPFTFGTVASYHARKNLPLLIASFIEAFGPDDPFVRLIVHSNLAFGTEYKQVADLIKTAGAKNITLSCRDLPTHEYVDLMDSFDAFVQLSRGEGYSIPPRQALALGKPCILSDSLAHRSLCESELVLPVQASIVTPAIYEEISGMVFGAQESPLQADVTDALRKCYEDQGSPELAERRRQYASQFSVPELSEAYVSLLRPSSVFTVGYNAVRDNCLLTSDPHLAARFSEVPRFPAVLRRDREKKLVLIGHDGGYFSVFNTFLSHLVWHQDREGLRYVLPDWRVTKMMEAWKTDKFTSFCYGRPEDGNIWLKLYEPLYPDVDPACYNSDEFLYKDQGIYHSFNAEYEPLLTYIHAYKLYRRPDFYEWRQLYNAYYRKYVHILPHIRKRADEIYRTSMQGFHCIGVHARHPSHAIEQPDGSMPYLDTFVELARGLRTGRKTGQDWRIFLATDQATVIKYFQDRFGDRVVYVNDLVRTTEEQDAAFQNLSAAEKHREGHQIQHLTAADSSRWNTKMAEEVLVDSLLLSMCNSFVHTTSNIATAVAIMNPESHMVYCE